MSSTLLKNVHLFDPGSGLDAKNRNIHIEEGRIVSLDASIDARVEYVLDGKGRMCLPGLIDLRAHFCEPGGTRRETIESGCKAAAKGGYTTVLIMPTTEPTVDRIELVELIHSKAREAGTTRVLPVGAVSVGRKGERLSEMAKLTAAGCAAFSDGDRTITDSQLLRYALETAAELGTLIISHPSDKHLALGGMMHEGVVSTRLGLTGIPSAAEVVGVSRDIAIAAMTGSRLHLGHVSTAESVDLIRQAKDRGVLVTAKVSPLHLALSDEAVLGYDTQAKLFPPLRPQTDVGALIRGLADGTLDAVATDHLPQNGLDKNTEFDRAEAGAIGLESSLGIILGLVADGHLTLERAISSMTRGPAQVLGREDLGRLKAGGWADLVLVSPDERRLFSQEDIASKSRNSPWLGRELVGRVILTMAAGEITYQHDEKRVSAAGVGAE